MRVHVSDAGSSCHTVHHSGDHVTVERSAVVGQKQPRPGIAVGFLPPLKQFGKWWQKRNQPVVSELSHRDLEPVSAPSSRDGILLERAQLAHPHAGPREQLDHHPPQQIRLRCRFSQKAGSGCVVEGLRKRLLGTRDVAHIDRVAVRDPVIAPFDDAVEEAHEHPESHP